MEESPEDDQRIVNRYVMVVRERLEDLGTYIRITGAQKILRRYFAMNAFDGAMTSLGVVIGSRISGITEPKSVIGVIMVSAIAMMVSGFSGTYITERAERSHSLNELENAMLSDLENSIYGRASRFVSLFAAFIDGLAPFIASIPSVLPFVLVPGLVSYTIAYYLSIGASLATLFILGVYLGTISGESLIYSGLKMVISGIAVAVIALILNGHA